jgi:monomeric sarcosine oxidase
VTGREYGVAVVGAGALGSGAAYWFSRVLGEDVLCLEQYELGHGLGASEDHSRIIRLGYHAERYTALTRASFEAWEAVEQESRVPLVLRTGAINVGVPGTAGYPILDDYEAAMRAHDIPYERLSVEEATRRWPQFRMPAAAETVFQPDGGILDVRKGVAAQLALARARGATVVPHAAVEQIVPGPDAVELVTAQGSFRAREVVLCAGAWTAGLLRGTLGVDWPIRLMRQQVTYFATPHVARFAPDRFPIWIWHDDEEHYGFPVFGEVATKAAREILEGDPIDLAAWDRRPLGDEVAALARFLDEFVPGSAGPELHTRVCVYDLPPDRDFVLDRLPGVPRVTVAIGAGHAAKFASLFGRVLAELVLEGVTAVPIEPFRADRPALTDPGFSANYRLGVSAVAPG